MVINTRLNKSIYCIPILPVLSPNAFDLPLSMLADFQPTASIVSQKNHRVYQFLNTWTTTRSSFKWESRRKKETYMVRAVTSIHQHFATCPCGTLAALHLIPRGVDNTINKVLPLESQRLAGICISRRNTMTRKTPATQGHTRGRGDRSGSITNRAAQGQQE